MNKISTLFFTALFLTTAGCATTSNNLSEIEKSTPDSFTLPINYIDAYSNAKSYYLKCVASIGTSYPITIDNNGSPVTITSSTPIVTISTKLDRQAKSATLDIIEGTKIRGHIVFSEVNKNTTNVAFYSNNSILFGLLRSNNHNQKAHDAKIDLLKSVSSEKTEQCIE